MKRRHVIGYHELENETYATLRSRLTERHRELWPGWWIEVRPWHRDGRIVGAKVVRIRDQSRHPWKQSRIPAVQP